MKPSLKTRIFNFLFEIDTAPRKQVVAAPVNPAVPPVPPINEKLYLTVKLQGMLPTTRFGQGCSMNAMSVDTLRMMIDSPRIGDLGQLASSADETEDAEELIRSVVTLLNREDMASYSGDAIRSSYEMVSHYHFLGFKDLSVQDPLTIDRVAAATRIFNENGRSAHFPPQLTYYTMQHHEHVDDILSYLKSYHKDKASMSAIDFERLDEYVKSDTTALREGIL